MPELPEVETTVRGIQPHLTGQRIQTLRIRQARLRWPVDSGLSDTLAGTCIHKVWRRAKFIMIDADPGTLLIHLGMSGTLRILPEETPLKKHDHIDLILENHQILRYNDPRRFGAWLFSPTAHDHPLLAQAGPEPLSESFDGDYLYRVARGRRSPIKTFCMDNHVVVGVGNIYASESLFKAGIHPKRAAEKISLPRYEKLAQAIKQTLQQAILAGGTTLKDFVREDGQPGYFKQSLQVYGRANEPCHRCQTSIRQIRIGQRSSYYCPRCQR